MRSNPPFLPGVHDLPFASAAEHPQHTTTRNLLTHLHLESNMNLRRRHRAEERGGGAEVRTFLNLPDVALAVTVWQVERSVGGRKCCNQKSPAVLSALTNRIRRGIAIFTPRKILKIIPWKILGNPRRGRTGLHRGTNRIRSGSRTKFARIYCVVPFEGTRGVSVCWLHTGGSRAREGKYLRPCGALT